jgi:alpha-beta hydrolase superfamily lysophospholipase
LIFFPERLSQDHHFSFIQNFEEIFIRTTEGITLHSILFKADKPKRVIFYLHGNAGSLNSWGAVAGVYTDLNYDVFMLDYRGYGKSEGSIKNEQQLINDVQIAYDSLKSRYDENKIIVLGYSIGTGLAARVASVNHPRLLILQAPFYNLRDLAKNLYPIIPTFILKYKFETNKHIQKCAMPVVLFHGDQDEIIYHNSSVKLKTFLKKDDVLITLKGEGHNGMSSNSQYLFEIKKLLEE